MSYCELGIWVGGWVVVGGWLWVGGWVVGWVIGWVWVGGWGVPRLLWSLPTTG